PLSASRHFVPRYLSRLPLSASRHFVPRYLSRLPLSAARHFVTKVRTFVSRFKRCAPLRNANFRVFRDPNLRDLNLRDPTPPLYPRPLRPSNAARRPASSSKLWRLWMGSRSSI